MSQESKPQPGRSLTVRILGVFTRVEEHEVRLTLLLMLNVFILLTSYYLLKTVREPLILAGGGAELKSYTAAGQALLMLVAVPWYSALVNRSDGRALVNRMTLFFASNLAIFYLLARLNVPYLGVPFFIWVGIFSLTIIAQFWSLANDLMTAESGERIFPLVVFGSSMGAVSGAWVAGILLRLGIGIYELMLVAGALLLAYVALTTLILRGWQSIRSAAAAPATAPPVNGGEKVNGLTLVLRDRYLLLIAALMFLTNLVNTNGEYILGRVVTAAAHAELPLALEEEVGRWIGGFYSTFFTLVNILSALLQLVAVSRILRYAGVRIALLVLPVVSLGSYALISLTTTLAVIRAAKILENSTDYSLQNTTRHALFLPTSKAAKYKGKQVIDTFFVRMGDVTSALVVLAGVTLGLGVRGFALVNTALVCVWLVIALGLGRRYAQSSREHQA